MKCIVFSQRKKIDWIGLIFLSMAYTHFDVCSLKRLVTTGMESLWTPTAPNSFHQSVHSQFGHPPPQTLPPVCNVHSKFLTIPQLQERTHTAPNAHQVWTRSGNCPFLPCIEVGICNRQEYQSNPIDFFPL